MKVARVETFLVPPRWLFCRVETDDGVVGWGEPVLEGNAETVRTAVHLLAERLIGADPLRIEDHWQVLSKGNYFRPGPILSSAVAGLDQALWDIAGKVHDVPVHALLGGPVRDRIRMYGWVGGDDPAQIGEAARARVEAGFTAVKFNAAGRLPPSMTAAEVSAVAARAADARAALGEHYDFAVDCHGRVSPASAPRMLAALEEYAPMFVEEPLLPEHQHAFPDLQARTTIPLATGERLLSCGQFLPVLNDGVRIVQPDVSHAGGISEMRRIAILADAFGALLAPHCPLGPIALASCLQVDLVTSNFLIQEQSLGIHYNDGGELLDYLFDTSVFDLVDGHIERTTGPGLGITIDEAAVRAADRRGHAWRSPVWRLPDGSYTEW